MIRNGLLIAVLLGAGHATAAPYTFVSLEQTAASAPALHGHDRAEVSPVGPGAPVGWDLLPNDRPAPVGGVCTVIGDIARSGGRELAVDPALILQQLQARGYCKGDAG